MYQIISATTYIESGHTYRSIDGTFDRLQDAERVFDRIMLNTRSHESEVISEHSMRMWLSNRAYNYAILEISIVKS